MTAFEPDILACLEVLRKGGIILYPSDTGWSLGGDATDPIPIDRINQLKQRPPSHPMTVLLTGEQDILNHVAAPDLALFDYLLSCTNPTTVVYEGAIGFADNLVGPDGGIAIRICQDPFCRHLIKRFGKPILITSATIHGEPRPGSFDQISAFILDGVDYAVIHRRDSMKEAIPSTLIRWESGTPIILRP